MPLPSALKALITTLFFSGFIYTFTISHIKWTAIKFTVVFAYMCVYFISPVHVGLVGCLGGCAESTCLLKSVSGI